jgi:flagellar biosynthesis protein FlhB
MADERDDIERSEEATPKRREEARRKGQVAKSRLLLPALSLMFFIGLLHFVGLELLVSSERLIVGFFALAGQHNELSREQLFALTIQCGLTVGVVLIPLFAGVLLVEVGGGLAQTGFLWTNELLRPDFARINPITGFQRLFSFDTASELLKTLLCIVGIGAVGVAFLYARLEALSSLMNLDAAAVALYVSEQGVHLLKLTVGILTVIALLDYFLQRWRTESQLRMSRQEIKEELREQDGDPQIKNRLKSIRLKMARQRMMAEVPKADVVITNPEELAVALRYRAEEMSAPRVVAKGAGHIARQIRAVARAHGIPIAENKPVARLLYRTVEVGKQIPENLYRTVAEVLAYVYRLRQGRGKVEASEEQ